MKLPPMDPWAPGVRGVDVPIVDNGDPPFDFAELPEPEFNIEDIDMPEPGETNSFEDHVNGVEQPLPAPGAPMVELALDYALRGWPVFPCMPTNKAPYVKGWLNAATMTRRRSAAGGQLAARHDRRADGTVVRLLGSRSRSTQEEENHDGPRSGRDLSRSTAGSGHAHRGHAARRTPHPVQMGPDRPVTNSPGALVKTASMSAAKAATSSWRRPSASATDAKNVAGQYRVTEPLTSSSSPQRRTGSTIWCWRTEAEPKSRPKRTMAMPRSSRRYPDDGKQFWRKVNDMAFRNLGAWVPDIFGSAAIYQPGTGAWRISRKISAAISKKTCRSRHRAARIRRLGSRRSGAEDAAPSTS